MRHDPASAAIVIMLRSLKMHGMSQAVTDLILESHRNALKQGAVLVDPSDMGLEPRLLFLIDHAGLPLKTVLEQLDLLGGEVVPVLRKELAAGRPETVPDAPTHAARVMAIYGDGPAREARPGANRGDNLTAGSPYQDGPALAGSSFGAAATRKGA